MAEPAPLYTVNRIEKANREHVIERLKSAFTYDHLDVEDFEERLEIATSTKDRATLEALVANLPALEIQDKPEEKDSIEQIRKSFKENGRIVGILGGVSKKNKWKVPRKLSVTNILGGVELDFTHAELPPGIIEVNIFNILGGVDITVPPGINVDADGIAILGGFDDKSSQDRHYPNAPTLRIRGFALLGGVEIKLPKKKILSRILKKFNLID